MRLRLLLVVGLLVGLLPAGMVPAGATDLPGLAIDDPADHTPHIPTTGTVRGMAEVGDTIVVGGAFGAINKNEVLDRTNLAAFDADTGAIVETFAPQLNGEVYDVVAVPGEAAVVVAGFFTQVNGEDRRYLVKLGLDGKIDPSFTSQADRPVYTAVGVGSTIYLGGNFRSIGGQARNRLAAVDASTGSVVSDFRFAVAEPRNTAAASGFLHVFDLAVSEDESKVVVIGNFTKTANVTQANVVEPFLDRTQVVVIDNAASPARIDADWRTRAYEPDCVATENPYTMYVRDVDVADDASYFVIATAGFWGPGDSTCDTAARFDLFRTGQDIEPTWLSYTGGDTLLQSHIDDEAVYIGGHPRRANNPFGRDNAGPGAVPREVVYAVDPRNGVPLRWNPTIQMRDPVRPERRGYGVEAFLATDEGLWVGSDMRFANDEYHNKIMLFPPGPAPDQPVPATLPAVAQVVRDDGTLDEVDFDGTTATALGRATTDPRVNWASVVSSWRMGERLYTFTTDRRLYRYDDGGGSRIRVSLLGLETTDRVQDERVHRRWLVENVRGTAYDQLRGRLYYTMNGDDTLYWRGFTADTDVTGALLHEASSAVEFRFDRVDGMFLSGDDLYVARPDGALDRIRMDDGLPVAGSTTRVSGPTTDGVNWSGRALHLQSDASTTTPNLPPDVAFDVTCDASGACTFDATATTDRDGTVTSWDWFVDGVAVGSGRVLTTTIADEGAHEVRLVATDDDGAASLGTRQVTTTADPVADLQVSCEQRSCTFDASGSRDGDDPVVSASWVFGDGVTGQGLVVKHDYAAEGSYDVTVTVTDDEGAVDTATTQVTVTEPAGEIGFRAVANTNTWSPSPTVTIPPNTLSGDTMLLYASVADPNMLAGAPSNGDWQLLGSRAVSRHESHVWWRVADADDAGTDVTVPLSAGRKVDLTLAVYEDANEVAPIASWASAAETVQRADHQSPTVTTTTDALIVSFWAQKSSNTSDWAAPTGERVRSESIGSGGGMISTLLTDGGGTVPAGTAGGLVATADEPALTATAWTVALSKRDTSDEVTFTGSDSDNRWTTTPTVTVPASTTPGDLLLLVASVSWLDVTPDSPTGVGGWTRLDRQGDGVETTIWWKAATADDIGADVTVPLDRGKKVDLSIVSYDNVNTVSPFVAQQHVLETEVRGAHTTPQVRTSEPGFVVSYWADKSESTTDWAEPTGEAIRVESTGVGGGRVGVLITDQGVVSPAGTVGGLTATADSANDSGLQWTLVLRPA